MREQIKDSLTLNILIIVFAMPTLFVLLYPVVKKLAYLVLLR